MELGPEDVSLLERCPHFRKFISESHMSPVTNIHESLACTLHHIATSDMYEAHPQYGAIGISDD